MSKSKTWLVSVILQPTYDYSFGGISPVHDNNKLASSHAVCLLAVQFWLFVLKANVLEIASEQKFKASEGKWVMKYTCIKFTIGFLRYQRNLSI